MPRIKCAPPEKQKELVFNVLGGDELQTPMRTTVEHYLVDNRSYFVLRQDANDSDAPPDTIMLEEDDICRIHHMLKGH